MDPSKISVFNIYDKSKKHGGAASFATFMIIGPVCFFLGMLFSMFPYDFPLLWTNSVTPPEYFDFLENHIKFLHASPPVIPRILHIAISIGFLGFFIKLFKPSEANLLFDGASLVLYVIGVVVYITNIVKGFRIMTLGIFDNLPAGDDVLEIGREDSLRVLAASNTILALVLVGVLVLQAGQWYAEKKDKEADEKFAKEKEEKTAAKAITKTGGHATRSASKKKQ